jgi:hypothetical protein
MGFERVYITKQGALLAAKTLQGKKIEFDHAEIGSGNLSGNAVDKTSLTTKVLECPIQKVEITEDTQAKVSFIFKNTDAKSAFYFREIGLFAIDPDTKAKVLYAYTNAGTTAEYINNSIAEKIEKHITINVIVDNASNVTITLDSSEIYVTEKDLENALQNAKLYSGKNYGIKRLITDNTLPTWTRIADAEGLTANATKNGTEVANDFDNLYPWSHIRKCNVDAATGQVLAYYGETGFQADGSNGEVMVKIPEFWWKRERLPDEFGNVYEYIYIADYARAGYKKSEEFFVGAYIISTETTEGDTIIAHSRSGAIPKYNTTKANFRNYAKALGEGWQLMDYHYFLLQMLYLVEYAHYNSQSMLGNGIVGFNTAKALIAENNVNRIIVSSVGTGLWVGKTICIGATDAWNSSVAADREITSIEDYNDGQVTGKAIHFNGDPVNIAVNNVIWGSAQKTGENDSLGNASGCLINDSYHSVNYRGIENIFGHMWQHIDGLNIKDYIAYICKDPASYENDKFDAPYEKIGYVNAETTDSYIKKLGLDEKHPEVALPTEIGASSSTGACDNYWCAEGNRIACVGGNFGSTWSKAGFFAWGCSGTSSHAGWNCGARLLKHQ